MPSLAQALSMAMAGCCCRHESGPATTPCAPISASQVRPSSSAFALLMTTTAAAPSEIWEAEPAVMVPSLANAGRRLAERVGGGVGADALVGLELEGLALALRDRDRDDLVVEQAVLPGLRGELVAARGELVLLLAGERDVAGVGALGEQAHRLVGEGVPQAVVGHVVADGDVAVLVALTGLPSRCGALVIDSWPPATTMSYSPARIIWSAMAMALMPERQTLLIVSAGTLIGMPALTAACRAGIWPAPAWSTWPMIT